MKASLIKTIEEGEDVDLVLLTYKTTLLNHRAAELKKIQDSATNSYSTHKTAGNLQTDHGPRKTNTGTTVQQEH